MKLERAADAIGITESRLSHKFQDGTLTLAQIERLGPEYLASFGRQLVEVYAPLDTPKARAQRLMDTIESSLREMRQAVEFLE